MTLRDAPAPHLAFVALHLVLGHFGTSPRAYARHNADGPHTNVTRKIAFVSLAWFGSIVATALSDRWASWPPGRPLLAPPMALGWALGAVGLVGMLATQAGMGE